LNYGSKDLIRIIKKIVCSKFIIWKNKIHFV
jgi:hypothetical protein